MHTQPFVTHVFIYVVCNGLKKSISLAKYMAISLLSAAMASKRPLCLPICLYAASDLPNWHIDYWSCLSLNHICIHNLTTSASLLDLSKCMGIMHKYTYICVYEIYTYVCIIIMIQCILFLGCLYNQQKRMKNNMHDSCTNGYAGWQHNHWPTCKPAI